MVNAYSLGTQKPGGQGSYTVFRTTTSLRSKFLSSFSLGTDDLLDGWVTLLFQRLKYTSSPAQDWKEFALAMPLGPINISSGCWMA